MSQSFRLSFGRPETNLLASARIFILDGKVVKHGAAFNGIALQRPEQAKDEDGNPVPMEMDPDIFDFCVRHNAINKDDPLITRKGAL